MTDYYKKIEEIFKNGKGYLKTKDVLNAGINGFYLNKLQKEGTITRIKKGVYRWNDFEFSENEDLIQISKLVPDGVICLLSAISYYEMTTYNPFEYYMAIHRDSHKPILPEYLPIKLVFFSDKQYLEGIEILNIEGNEIKIYCLEKTICDIVRYRKKIGTDIVKEVLNNYVASKNKNINKLMNYAEILRAKNVIKEYMEVLI